jgi:hypothetical protein
MPAPAGAHSPASGDGAAESSGAAEAQADGASETAPTDATEPPTRPADSSPTAGSSWPTPSEPSNEWSADASGAIPSDRPEVAVGAAFAGGFLLAMFLRRLAR